MAELIRSVEDEVPISYGRFDLFDGFGGDHVVEPEVEAGALLVEPDQVALGQVGMKSQDGRERRTCGWRPGTPSLRHLATPGRRPDR
ncbi:hypothetical protein Ssi03_45190 [Sphaerisporangium siamense]|nr:hypothetical protein Ssi03_45190 [Sphaerisporangium siamense]